MKKRGGRKSSKRAKKSHSKKEKRKVVKKKVRKISKKRAKKSKKRVKKSVEKKTKRKSVGKVVLKGKKVSDRIPTWIAGFDSLIAGGFRRNSTNLVVGGSGSGKSIFATQFLVEAMKKGEKCLFVTFEEKRDQFYSNMKSLGWDLEDFEKRGLFTFLEYTPIKVRTMLEEGGGAIETIIFKKKVTRMVIDSVTSFALLFEDEFAKREAALSLFGMLRSWDCTTLLTLEEEPAEKSSADSRALEFEVDSIVAIYFARHKMERQRFLEVLKMRGTDHSKKIYPFDIGKNGVSIRKSPVAKI